VFVPRDLPHGFGLQAADGQGNAIAVQLDQKATHRDGSLRHAVITLLFHHFASGQEVPVVLRRTPPPARDGGKTTVSLSDLPADFDVVVVLKQNNHRLAASARALLKGGRIENWLHGPLVSEWWVAGPLRDERGHPDPHLGARIGIRCYGKGQPLRLDVVVENDWTFVSHPRTETYDVEIRAGGKTRFAQAKVIQPSQTRWRRGFWWDDAVFVYVKQDLDHLRKARVVPNYDPELRISEVALARMYDAFEHSSRGPMDSGIVTAYMPTTGGRLDIAPLPEWQAMYLLTMDPRAYEMTLQSGDLGASFPSHFRNERNGRPVTPEDYPNMSTVDDLFGEPGQPQRPDTGGFHNPLVPDPAHEPALDFLPYLITGDRFYLEELQFWTMWNALYSGPQYRGYGAGLIHAGQIRGQAWSLRTLAQAEYITPDTDALKPVLRRELRANIDWYNANYTNNRSTNKLGMIERAEDYDGGRSAAPWQDDYFTWSVGYVQGLGDVDARALLRWKAKFSVGRMIAPGFCWILAASYTLRVRDRPLASLFADFRRVYQASLPDKLNEHARRTDPVCASDEMAQSLGLKAAGEMFQSNYSTYLQPALAVAVDSGVDGAQSAWKLFQSRAMKPDYADEPGWDIVPSNP
jgi:hypothetical protein